jgi:hypothetical protein
MIDCLKEIVFPVQNKRGIWREIPHCGIMCQGNFLIFIAVVINMFRLPDFLKGDNVMCNGLKLLQT